MATKDEEKITVEATEAGAEAENKRKSLTQNAGGRPTDLVTRVFDRNITHDDFSKILGLLLLLGLTNALHIEVRKGNLRVMRSDLVNLERNRLIFCVGHRLEARNDEAATTVN